MLHAPGYVRSMLLSVIPTEYEDELLSKPHIKTWQEIVQWCKLRTIYKRQKLLSEAARNPGGRINSLIDQIDDDQTRQQQQPQPESNDSKAPTWANQLINALSRNAPKPKVADRTGSREVVKPREQDGDRKNTKFRFMFKGCWHCGKDGHRRGACEDF